MSVTSMTTVSLPLDATLSRAASVTVPLP